MKLPILLTLLLTSLSAYSRDVEQIDANWKFTLGDPNGAEASSFDDSGWRTLDLPHDWAFEADYAKDAAQADRGGYKPGGIGWYRKTITIPADRNGQGVGSQRVGIQFEGAYMNSEVWVNGKHLGKRPYGYITFGYDLTPHIQPGKNIIAVRLDNSLEPSARWYHGCGIYSHVHLITTDPLHITTDGVSITTPEISNTQATVKVVTEVENEDAAAAKGTLKTSITDPSGKVVATVSKSFSLNAGATASIDQSATVPNPQRWDTATPVLYRSQTEVLIDAKVVDHITTRFGIRTIRWEAKTGFWINDRNIKLMGVCDHLEAGPVGAAYPDELLRWKIQLLKDMGCNAIRTAHNPQTPKFYDLCDEMGMFVMDEIFDGWSKKATEDYGKQAFSAWWERDLRSWLKRDRNHPCVVVWSLGNETHGKISKDLVRVCHEVDPTRLVTSGRSGTNDMDIEGVNGGSENQDFFIGHKTNNPLVATEAPHTWQVRGFYRSKTWWRFRTSAPQIKNGKGPFPCPDLTENEIFTYDWIAPNKRTKKQQFNPSYDTGITRITARKHWELVRDLPWYSGHFRWTGFDYLGEAGYVHGGWPFRAFMGGPLDLAGFQKDLYYFYQSQWTTKPMVHILPHWTHPQMKSGTRIPVWVYSNCDEVELILNGISLGKDKPGKPWDKMQCDWMVPWTPGTIEAIGYKNGKEVSRTAHTTAGVPARLKLSIEGESCPILTVTQTDTAGVMNPYAENRIHYHIDGPARLISLESGNPVNTENNTTTSRTAFFGLARAFFQTTRDSGKIFVTAAAILGEKQLMTSNVISIDVREIALRPIGADSLKQAYSIKYSTDGSKPTIDYTQAFSVKPDTTVKADVFRNGKLLFSMSEKFGPHEGIYWGSSDSADIANKGSDTQAEDQKFQGATISQNGKGFHGKGFLDFGKSKNGYLEFYRENDGGAGKMTLVIRYSGKKNRAKGKYVEIQNNGKVVVKKLLLPNTNNYGSHWKSVKVTIPNHPGANTIRITNLGQGGMCIDEVDM